MTALADFLSDIRPLMPSATVMSVTRSARKTARDFLRRTKAYQWGFDSSDYTVSGRTVTLTLPAGTELQQLLLLEHAGAAVYPSSAKDAARNYVAQGYYIEPPASFKLTMDVAGDLEGTAILIPAYNATTIPDGIFSRYYEILLNGTLADMYTMENSAWFNPNNAMLRGQQYELGVEEATRQVNGDDAFKPSLMSYGG